jgi:hypothetical protein
LAAIEAAKRQHWDRRPAIWVQFAATVLVIVLAGVRLARYGDMRGEKSGLGRSWIGVVLLAATTSLPACSRALVQPRSLRSPTSR